MLGPAALLLGFAYAAWTDWTTREVTDSLWVLLGMIGTAVAIGLAWPDGVLAVGLWLLLGAFVLEHVVPWDATLERYGESIPGWVEIGLYVAVGAIVGAVGLTYGVGPDRLPIGVIAVFVTVLLARALFEFGVLYGGADAKALMIAGLLVPLYPVPWIALPARATGILSIYPYSLSLLVNAGLAAVAVPLGLAIWNLSRGDFEFPRGFTSYRLPVRSLPERFVWLRDPTFGRLLTEEEREVGSAEEDRALRVRQRDELVARGVREVWVTPQLPFIVVLAVGAFTALLLGNLLFDALALFG